MFSISNSLSLTITIYSLFYVSSLLLISLAIAASLYFDIINIVESNLLNSKLLILISKTIIKEF